MVGLRLLNASRKRTRYMLCLTLLGVMICVQCTDGITDGIHTQDPENWFAARSKCQQSHGDLLISRQKSVNNFHHYTNYWIGGIEYSTWKWTYDHSPLYRHVGFLPINNDGTMETITIPGNSVVDCHRQCSSGTQEIGLSGTACYCLQESYLEQTSPETSVTKCPGNFDEKCGNNSGVSVYKIDVQFIASDTGRCAYAKKTSGRSVTLVAEDCSTKKRKACYEENVSHGCSNYYYDKCEGFVCTSCEKYTWMLANNDCSLTRICNSNKDDLYNVMRWSRHYWVGLHNYASRTFVDDSETSINIADRTSNQHCLAVLHNGDKFVLHWMPCMETYSSFCEIGNPPGPTTSPETSTEETTVKTTQIQMFTTLKSILTPTTSLSAENVTRDKLQTDMQDSPNKMIGVYVGASIGGVLVLFLTIILLVVLRRQGKLCFSNREKTNAIRYNTATENATYNLDGCSAGQTIISSTSRHTQDTEISMITPAPDVIPSSYGGTTNNNAFPQSPDVYTQVSRSGMKIQRQEGFQNQDQEDAGEEDDYSTTQQQESVPETDNCYQHIGQTEDDYDIAGSRQETNIRDDTYNHIGDREVQGNVTNAARTTERQLTDNRRETTDYYNMSTSTGENEGYYNIGFTKEGQPGVESENRKEDEGSVYTLSKAVSEI